MLAAGIPYGPVDDVFLQQIRGFYDAQAAAYLQPGSAGWYDRDVSDPDPNPDSTPTQTRP
jgi:hypothetical protein